MSEKVKVALIGRSELLFATALLLKAQGYKIPLVITAKEAPEYQVGVEDFEKFALEEEAVFIKTQKINSENIVNQIREAGHIDIAVSVNYSGIIEQNVIDLFPMGILNAHGGDLPRYRGNACQAWAIINGESRVGMCIHQMKGGELDSGDIIARDYFDLTVQSSIGQVYEWMESIIPTLFLKAVDALNIDRNYTLEIQSLNPMDALRCYPRNPDDGLIDWGMENIEILRLINASSKPFSGAFCSYDDSKLIIWEADIYIDTELYCAVPGQISKIRADGFIEVICGTGKLLIREIGYEGKRFSNPSEIIKSIRKRLK